MPCCRYRTSRTPLIRTPPPPMADNPAPGNLVVDNAVNGNRAADNPVPGNLAAGNSARRSCAADNTAPGNLAANNKPAQRESKLHSIVRLLLSWASSWEEMS